MSRLARRLRLACVAAAALTATAASPAKLSAQPVPIPAERLSQLAPPRVDAAGSAVRRQLSRLAWLAEHQQWEPAATLAIDLAAADPGELLPGDEQRYTPVADAVAALMAALPSEGAAVYHDLARLSAESRLCGATERRDADALAQLVDEFPGSVIAARALWLHGELALERGDWRTAAANWARVATVLDAASPTTLGQLRGAGITAAEAESRQIVAAIRGGQGDAAARRIEASPSDELNNEQRTSLRQLLDEAQHWPPVRPSTGEWPQQGANAQRTNALAAASGAPRYTAVWTAALVVDDYGEDSDEAKTLARLNFALPPAVFPVASGRYAAWQDATGLHVRRLADGSSRGAPGGPAFTWPPVARRSSGRVPQLAFKLPSYAATIDGRTLLAAAPRALAPSRNEGPEPLLAGVELGGGGRLQLRATSDPGDAFAGAPAVSGNVAVVPVSRASGASHRVGLVGLDRETGAETWRLWLGSADTPAAGQAFEYPQMGVAAVEGVALVTTNLGMVAAVRMADGRPLWLRTYPRTLVRDDYGGVRFYAAFPQIPLVIGDTLVAAPLDADRVFAWHALTGEPRWSTPLPAANVRVLAADGQRVLLAGERPWALDAATGRVEPAWGANLWGGAGQGAVVGDWLLWPTDGSVKIVDKLSCEPAGEPLELPASGGANVVATGGGEYLLAAGRHRLIVFRRTVPPEFAPSEIDQAEATDDATPADSSPPLSEPRP